MCVYPRRGGHGACAHLPADRVDAARRQWARSSQASRGLRPPPPLPCAPPLCSLTLHPRAYTAPSCLRRCPWRARRALSRSLPARRSRGGQSACEGRARVVEGSARVIRPCRAAACAPLLWARRHCRRPRTQGVWLAAPPRPGRRVSGSGASGRCAGRHASF